MTSSKSLKFSLVFAFSNLIVLLTFFYFLFLQILSLFSILTIQNIQIVILFSLILSTIILWSFRLLLVFPKIESLQAKERFLQNKPQTKLGQIGTTYIVYLNYFFIILFFIINLVLVYSYPPTNYDSMTYRLPRSEYWLFNQSIFDLDSSVSRQSWNPKLAETLQYIVRAFSNSDHYLGLIQLVALVMIILILHEFTFMITNSKLMASTVSLLTLAWPSLSYQATTTQNDLVVSFFIAMGALWMLHFLHLNDGRLAITMSVISLSLAIATKGTALVITAALFFSILVVRQFRDKLLKKRYSAFFALIISGFLIPLLNIGTWIDNYQNFGKFLAPKDLPGYTVTVSRFGLDGLILNIIRFISSNLQIQLFGLKQLVDDKTQEFLETISLDANDPEFTWAGGYKPVFGNHHDVAQSPVILVCIIAVISSLLIRRKYLSTLDYISLFTIISFFLLVGFLRWQPWINRLFVPIYVLLMFSISVCTRQSGRIVKSSLVALSLIFGSTTIFYSTMQMDRPIFKFSAENQVIALDKYIYEDDFTKYFTWNKRGSDRYLATLKTIEKEKPFAVLIYSGRNSMQYPAIKYLKQFATVLPYEERNSINYSSESEKYILLCIDECPQLSNEENSSFTVYKINVFDK
jgi:hypothetical protein